VEARQQFVYKQEQLVAIRLANGKMACQQKREFTVAPGPQGVQRQLVRAEAVTGYCDDDSRKSVAAQNGSATADGLTVSFGDSKDGIPRDLFPLTAKEQRLYQYRLEATEMYRGRQVYRVSFSPKPAQDGDEGCWKGEALIDAAEFQPLQVVTDLAVKVPLAVRILLGTNVRGLGFSVSYQRVAEGVWFPASFGGEFKLNVLFFYRRSVSINVRNSDFKRTNVDSNVAFDKIQ
jgi:hypothetical protein